ncbi:katanin p60 ATPase-containing subunit A-like 2 [Sycon ciliatum]|uniref:katanin p60 ATPase-containing subunit A-like 2 n=1 Tax=Sycon ciliatum TaxID=27933 RepID=UPI0031F69F6F
MMSQDLSYLQLKHANEARVSEEAKTAQTRKDLLILTLEYLRDEGYLQSVQTLERESGLSLNRYGLCDNVDLPLILQEFESYHYVKFRRIPKISKKLAGDGHPGSGHKIKGHHTLPKLHPTPPLPRRAGNSSSSTASITANPSEGKSTSLATQLRNNHKPFTLHSNGNGTEPSRKQRHTNSDKLPGERGDRVAVVPPERCNSPSPLSAQNEVLFIQGSQPKPAAAAAGVGGRQVIDMRSMLKDAIGGIPQVTETQQDRLLKPIAGMSGFTGEMRDLAEVISREIYSEDPDVHWKDIIGLEGAKRLIKEAVVYPIKYPQIFTGILSPWKGLLLYGPPGTGKTLMAKAVATECHTTFFNISASTIVSKWRGDSEKLVKVLFELARYHAPSTIFLDELDSVMSKRGSGDGMSEHEGSRRLKTELLVQMDGLAKSSDNVFVLAASNLPWELDAAMLRRLEKRIIVDLPVEAARKAMMEHYLPPHTPAENGGLAISSSLDYGKLAQMTENYSGSDIKLVCKEAAMRPVRRIFDCLENYEASGGEFPQLTVRPIEMSDVEAALEHTKPSAHHMAKKYQAFQRDFEST